MGISLLVITGGQQRDFFFARVVQWQETPNLKFVQCGFESRLAYLLKRQSILYSISVPFYNETI